MEEIIIPVSLFLIMAAALIFFLAYRHKNFIATQETLRKLIDSTHNLTPEMVQAIGVKGGAFSSKPQPFSDLRRALLFIGFGLATAVFGQFIPDQEPSDVFTGLSFFPLFIGLGYLAAHYLTRREDVMR